MPKASVNGIELYYEEAGSGTPIVFVHEFGGDYRSWESQMRFFSGRYRAVTFSARGYLPSTVPEEASDYGQDLQIEDLRGLLDDLGIDKAHICGLSMGSYTTLLFGLKHPERVRSLTIAGSGYGSGANREVFHAEVNEKAREMDEKGMEGGRATFTLGPARVQLQNKNPRAWKEFDEAFLAHSAHGSANTLRKVQGERPSVFDLEAEMRALTLPALIMLGDEDDAGIEGSLLMKRCIPRAGLQIYSRCGHTLNLEEPELFNRSLLDFITAVDGGRLEARDPRSMTE